MALTLSSENTYKATDKIYNVKHSIGLRTVQSDADSTPSVPDLSGKGGERCVWGTEEDRRPNDPEVVLARPLWGRPPVSAALPFYGI